ncbi:hypothetical protein [Streptomyces sp. NPDC048340]|uniref:hypothetical protein n=1 Tax=Streptomyces sp. NPDC048340 TaxID=3365537 RepID=UPI003721D1C5
MDDTAQTLSPQPGAGTAAAGPLLGYKVTTSPDALQAGGKARITLCLTNITASPVTVSAVTIGIRIGSGKNDLTEDSSFTTWPHAGWEMGGHRAGVFPVRPKDGPETLGVGDSVQFAIEGFRVNRHPGETTPVTVTAELVEPKKRDQFRKQLSKLQGGFALYDFGPEQLVIGAGTRATVAWRVHQPGAAAFTMTHPHDHDRSSKDTLLEKGARSYSLPSIWRTTPFRLTAALGRASYSVFTMVHVTDANLITGDLTVNGTCDMLRAHEPTNFGPGEPRRSAQRSDYTAATDGILTATLKTIGTAVNRATLRITVKDARDKTQIVFAAEATCFNDTGRHDAGERVEIPIETGQHITVETDHEINPVRTGRQCSYYTAELAFHSFGTAALTHNGTRWRDH